METTESVPKVYEAISTVMGKLAADGISKSRKNEQQGYKFRGIDDVYNALSRHLSDAKLCILPRVLERSVTERTTQKGGVLFYVVLTVEYDIVSAIDGSKHVVRTIGEAMDSADKATNKAMSAAYKYLAIEVFCIPTEAENDADATTHDVAARIIAAKVTPMQDHIDAFNLLPAAAQQVIREHALELISIAEENGDMVAFVEKHEYDNEGKLALWTQLPSHVRSAFKRQQSEQRQTKQVAAIKNGALAAQG